jgi:hypothetical protein
MTIGGANKIHGEGIWEKSGKEAKKERKKKGKEEQRLRDEDI